MDVGSDKTRTERVGMELEAKAAVKEVGGSGKGGGESVGIGLEEVGGVNLVEQLKG